MTLITSEQRTHKQNYTAVGTNKIQTKRDKLWQWESTYNHLIVIIHFFLLKQIHKCENSLNFCEFFRELAR